MKKVSLLCGFIFWQEMYLKVFLLNYKKSQFSSSILLYKTAILRHKVNTYVKTAEIIVNFLS